MPDPVISLRDKVVLQFGGSGLLGRALRGSLVEAGAQLVVASRTPETLENHAEEEADSTPVSFEQVDITSEKSLRRLLKRVISNYSKIDGLVFNSVSRPMRSADANLSQWADSMTTNATGLFATLRMFGDAMATAGGGSIVNIASQMGVVGPKLWLYEGGLAKPPPDYFFHKGGMINLTRYLAAHYGPNSVRVNAVSPGGIRNPDRPQTDDFIDRYSSMTPLGRMAEAPEIGGAVAFLLSDASTYITGVNLAVDGGYTAI